MMPANSIGATNPGRALRLSVPGGGHGHSHQLHYLLRLPARKECSRQENRRIGLPWLQYLYTGVCCVREVVRTCWILLVFSQSNSRVSIACSCCNSAFSPTTLSGSNSSAYLGIGVCGRMESLRQHRGTPGKCSREIFRDCYSKIRGDGNPHHAIGGSKRHVSRTPAPPQRMPGLMSQIW